MASLPELPDDLEETRATLHAYAHAVGALPRSYATFHPKWWHISLAVRPDSLVTEAFPLPDGGSAFVRMDLIRDLIVFATSHGDKREFPMNAGLTATEMGDALIAAASEFGLDGEYDRDKFESDDARAYDSAVASGFFDVLVAVQALFTEHRNTLSGEVGPIQLWPHGFDLAFEWFGTRKERYEEDGVVTEHPSQLNLGFYPAGDAYFYSNSWPFEADKLTGIELPSGARWNTEGWEGSMLTYEQIQANDDATDDVLAYAKAVYEAAAPTLTV
jgi:hypothetical protein